VRRSCGLSRPEARLAASVFACAAMFGVVLYHDRSVLRPRRLVARCLTAIAVAAVSALILYGRFTSIAATRCLATCTTAPPGCVGWGFSSSRRPWECGSGNAGRMCTFCPSGRCRRWAVVLFGLMGFGGRPLGLASFRFPRARDLRLAFPPDPHVGGDGCRDVTGRPPPRQAAAFTSGSGRRSCCSGSRRFSRCTRNRMRSSDSSSGRTRLSR
jgi:hypothetical protein